MLPAFAVEVPFTAVVESIEFHGLDYTQQQTIRERIGVREGYRLDPQTRSRIGLELGKFQKNYTFSYQPGSKIGTAKLIITPGC